MLETIFLFAAVIGGTVMICQFLLTLVGMGDDGFDGGDGDFGGDAELGGDVHAGGDFGAGADGADAIEGDHHNAWGDVDDVDTHHPDSSWLFGIVSFRTVVAAIAFFGISGFTARSADVPPIGSLIVALVAGFAAMYGTYWLMRQIMRLNSSGNENIGNAIGQHAVVYVPIPPARGGAGKVQFSMQNRIVEFPAVTEEGQSLKTGEAVEVVAINGRDTVEVRRIAAAVDV